MANYRVLARAGRQTGGFLVAWRDGRASATSMGHWHYTAMLYGHDRVMRKAIHHQVDLEGKVGDERIGYHSFFFHYIVSPYMGFRALGVGLGVVHVHPTRAHGHQLETSFPGSAMFFHAKACLVYQFNGPVIVSISRHVGKVFHVTGNRLQGYNQYYWLPRPVCP